jgi:nicotinamidase-related amidase
LEDFDNSKAALLVMDVYQHVATFVGDAGEGLLERLPPVIDAFRDAGTPVIYVRNAFRPGIPDVNPRNRRLHSRISALAEDGVHFGENDPATQFHPAVAPRPEDPIVVKKRVSAFTGSDLDLLLRSLGVETVVLTGVSTGGVVLATTCEAYDRDYRVIVLSDCCLDGDAEVHRLLTEKVFSQRADVATAEEVLRMPNRQSATG